MNVPMPEKPVLWTLTKRPSSSAIERKGRRIIVEGLNDLTELVAQLNRYERENTRLKNQLQEITSRT